MKKIVVLLVVVFCAMMAVAQDAPKVEVFGGYQYMNVDTKGTLDRLNFNGWDADVAAHFTKNFSIVGDISGVYKTEQGVDVKIYNYLFGPRISGSGKVSPFAEALFGVGHLSAGTSVSGVNASISSNGYAMALGGGVDVSATPHVGIRLVKFDYLLNHVSSTVFDTTASENLNNYRIATGIVFKF